MADLKLEIISPSGVLFKGECHLVVVPSVSGDLGVMRGHEIVIAALREGEVSIFDEKHNLLKSLPIASGFAKMQDEENLLVLVD